MDFMIGYFLLLTVLMTECTNNDPEDAEELRLFNYLFHERKYNKNIRPLNDKSKSVQVTLGLAYVQLVDLNIRSQTLKSNVWLRQVWTNEHLRWDKDQFGGVTEITVNKELLWLPDLVLYNNANPKMNRALVDQALTRITIRYDGVQKWFTPAMLYSSCSVDITFFPFDYQSCQLNFGSWTYDVESLNLTLRENAADVSFYLPSSEIKLLAFTGVRKFNYYPCCPAPYIEVSFNLYLKRLPGFYLYNVIIPSVTITLFALSAFAYPDENSGRTDLILSCFLSLVILSMMVSETMPVNSDTTPLIGVFMITSMAQMCLSGFVNIGCVILYKEKRQHVPRWLRVFAEMLGPYVRIAVPLFANNDPIRQALIINVNNDDEETEFNGNDVLLPSRFRNCQSRTIGRACRHSFRKHRQSLPTNTASSQFAITKRIIRDVDTIIKHDANRTEEYNCTTFWKAMSKVVDRISFLVLLFAWSTSVLFLALKIPTGM